MFVFSQKGQEAIVKLYKTVSVNFLKDIQRKWSRGGQQVQGDIIRNQLTGRKGNKGLNRVSGNAARALNTTTKIESGDVVQRVFLSQANPAKVYLPMHDVSRARGSGDFARGIIRPKTAKYLKFKTSDGKWHSVKQVRIPARIDILGPLQKAGGRMRIKSINDVLKSYAV